MKALSLSCVAVDLEVIVAPALAGIIIAVVGTRWVFRFDSATYIVSAALVSASVVPGVQRASEKLSLRVCVSEITHGTHAILKEPALRQAILLSFVEATAGAAAIVATVAYGQDVLGRGDTSVAVAMAALGFGSSFAALLLGRFRGRYEAHVSGPGVLHG